MPNSGLPGGKGVECLYGASNATSILLLLFFLTAIESLLRGHRIVISEPLAIWSFENRSSVP